MIDEARELPSIRRIGFTGGEPFLLGGELVHLVAKAHANGYRTTIVTSGHWAFDPDSAERRLAALADAGLLEISFSTGMQHSRFVPVERIVNGAVAAANHRLRVTISIETTADSKFDRDVLLRDARLEPLVDSGRITVFDRPWIAHADAAPGSSPPHEAHASRFLPNRISPCFSALTELTVLPSLALAACCGHPVESIPDLRIGSVASRTLLEAFTEADEAPLLELLRTHGPERLFSVAHAIDPAVRLPLESAHGCETCTLLHRDTRARAALDLVVAGARDLIAEQFEAAIS